MASNFEDDDLQLDAARQVMDTWESILVSRIRALRSSPGSDSTEIDSLQQQLYTTARERKALKAGDPAVAKANERYATLIAEHQARQGG